MTADPSTSSPADVPDILGMKIAHRVMLRDLDRTTGVTMAMADGGVPITRRRVRALVRYLELLGESIHHHHHAEDDILWPVIEQRAGSEIDLTPLTEDHQALGPKLDGLRVATGLFGDDPSRRTASVLAARLVEMRSMLTEHIAEEERDTFPVIRRYLTVADWQDVESRIRKAGARMTFELPRIAAAVTPAELKALKEQAGPMIDVMLALVKPKYRRMEKAIWG
ncbi:hemerythrin domain-containing protein [Mycolicibacterium mengxianglii]|uniref:hemerythrin domain-containing protein n=1 Tax=Mycolicibacterium mengxianglii TaxID=2736649 RepID=UPI0018D14684|nr:hemerythrin domain-containing protein [Mycolicibacterium mengxianglii]